MSGIEGLFGPDGRKVARLADFLRSLPPWIKFNHLVGKFYPFDC